MAKYWSLLLIVILSSACGNKTEHDALYDYLNKASNQYHYELIKVSPPDSAYSPLNALLTARYHMRTVMSGFKKRQDEIMQADIAHQNWDIEMNENIYSSDSLISIFYNIAHIEMDKYRLPKEFRPLPNHKIIKATFLRDKDTISGQFYYNRDGETIGHCITRIEKYINDIEVEYLKWKRIKIEALEDMDKLTKH